MQKIHAHTRMYKSIYSYTNDAMFLNYKQVLSISIEYLLPVAHPCLYCFGTKFRTITVRVTR